MKDVFKYKNLADLARSNVYITYLKPELEKIKAEFSQSEADPATEFEALKRDIKRSNSLFIVNRIIRFIEKAENIANKKYSSLKSLKKFGSARNDIEYEN